VGLVILFVGFVVINIPMIGEKIFKKNIKFSEMPFIVLLIFEITIIIYVNLFLNKYFISGFDSSTYIDIARKMWENKSLFLDDYAYQTTLLTGTNAPIAALLYGLLRNSILAYGLSNVLILSLHLFVLIRIIKDIKISKISALICMDLYFILWSIHDLGYANLLFIGHSAYGWIALTPLMFLSICLRFETTPSLKKQIGFCSFFVVFSFLTCLSSTLYTFVCGILPFLAYYFIVFLLRQDIKEIKKSKYLYILLIFVTTVIATLLSMRLNKIYGVSPYQGLLSPANEYFKNLQAAFFGIFELLGGMHPISRVPLLSKGGILYFTKYIVILTIIVSFFYKIMYTIKERENNLFVSLAATIFVIDFFVLTVTYNQYGSPNFENRYLLILTMPMFICFGLVVDQFKSILKNKIWIRNVMYSVFTMLMVLLSLSSVIVLNIRGYLNPVDKNWSVELAEEIIEKAKENDTTVFIADVNQNIVFARSFRALLEDIPVITVFNYNTAYLWGADKKYLDNTRLQGKTSFLTDSENFDKLPDYFKNNLILIQDYGYIQLFKCDAALFDFESGITGKYAIDKPYSPGYQSQLFAGFDESGNLLSNGMEGFALYGPYITVKKGHYNITLNYEILNKISEDDLARFEVSADTGARILESINLPWDSGSVTIENMQVSSPVYNVEFKCWTPEGVFMKIKNLRFEKVN
jgi:hypothetical protein